MADRPNEFDASTIKVVFFDLDDTIIAPGNAAKKGEEASLNILRKTHSKFELSMIDEKYAELSREMLNEFQSGTMPLAKVYDRTTRFRRLLKKLRIPDHSLAQRMAKEYWKVRIANTRLNEGALKVLRDLCETFSLGVITNGPTKWQEAKLTALGARPYIRYFIDSETVGHQKPQPEIFTYALDKAAVAPERAVMVGDSLEDDVGGARSVGMRTIWYKRREPVVLDTFFSDLAAEKTTTVIPDFEIEKLEELIPLLLK